MATPKAAVPYLLDLARLLRSKPAPPVAPAVWGQCSDVPNEDLVAVDIAEAPRVVRDFIAVAASDDPEDRRVAAKVLVAAPWLANRTVESGHMKQCVPRNLPPDTPPATDIAARIVRGVVGVEAAGEQLARERLWTTEASCDAVHSGDQCIQLVDGDGRPRCTWKERGVSVRFSDGEASVDARTVAIPDAVWRPDLDHYTVELRGKKVNPVKLMQLVQGGFTADEARLREAYPETDHPTWMQALQDVPDMGVQSATPYTTGGEVPETFKLTNVRFVVHEGRVKAPVADGPHMVFLDHACEPTLEGMVAQFRKDERDVEEHFEAYKSADEAFERNKGDENVIEAARKTQWQTRHQEEGLRKIMVGDELERYDALRSARKRARRKYDSAARRITAQWSEIMYRIAEHDAATRLDARCAVDCDPGLCQTVDRSCRSRFGKGKTWDHYRAPDGTLQVRNMPAPYADEILAWRNPTQNTDDRRYARTSVSVSLEDRKQAAKLFAEKIFWGQIKEGVTGRYEQPLAGGGEKEARRCLDLATGLQDHKVAGFVQSIEKGKWTIKYLDYPDIETKTESIPVEPEFVFPNGSKWGMSQTRTVSITKTQSNTYIITTDKPFDVFPGTPVTFEDGDEKKEIIVDTVLNTNGSRAEVTFRDPQPDNLDQDDVQIHNSVIKIERRKRDDSEGKKGFVYEGNDAARNYHKHILPEDFSCEGPQLTVSSVLVKDEKEKFRIINCGNVNDKKWYPPFVLFEPEPKVLSKTFTDMNCTEEARELKSTENATVLRTQADLNLRGAQEIIQNADPRIQGLIDELERVEHGHKVQPIILGSVLYLRTIKVGEQVHSHVYCIVTRRFEEESSKVDVVAYAYQDKEEKELNVGDKVYRDGKEVTVKNIYKDANPPYIVVSDGQNDTDTELFRVTRTGPIALTELDLDKQTYKRHYPGVVLDLDKETLKFIPKFDTKFPPETPNLEVVENDLGDWRTKFYNTVLEIDNDARFQFLTDRYDEINAYTQHHNREAFDGGDPFEFIFQKMLTDDSESIIQYQRGLFQQARRSLEQQAQATLDMNYTDILRALVKAPVQWHTIEDHVTNGKEAEAEDKAAEAKAEDKAAEAKAEYNNAEDKKAKAKAAEAKAEETKIIQFFKDLEKPGQQYVRYIAEDLWKYIRRVYYLYTSESLPTITYQGNNGWIHYNKKTTYSEGDWHFETQQHYKRIKEDKEKNEQKKQREEARQRELKKNYESISERYDLNVAFNELTPDQRAAIEQVLTGDSLLSAIKTYFTSATHRAEAVAQAKAAEQAEAQDEAAGVAQLALIQHIPNIYTSEQINEYKKDNCPLNTITFQDINDEFVTLTHMQREKLSAFYNGNHAFTTIEEMSYVYRENKIQKVDIVSLTQFYSNTFSDIKQKFRTILENVLNIKVPEDDFYSIIALHHNNIHKLIMDETPGVYEYYTSDNTTKHFMVINDGAYHQLQQTNDIQKGNVKQLQTVKYLKKRIDKPTRVKVYKMPSYVLNLGKFEETIKSAKQKYNQPFIVCYGNGDDCNQEVEVTIFAKHSNDLYYAYCKNCKNKNYIFPFSNKDKDVHIPVVIVYVPNDIVQGQLDTTNSRIMRVAKGLYGIYSFITGTGGEGDGLHDFPEKVLNYENLDNNDSAAVRLARLGFDRDDQNLKIESQPIDEHNKLIVDTVTELCTCHNHTFDGTEIKKA